MTTDPHRFKLAQFDDGAVLLDLTSGTFYRPNPIAAHIIQELANGVPVAEAARAMAATYGLPPASALRDVQAILDQLNLNHQPISTNPITFRTDSAGHVLHWQGQPFWHVDRRGKALTYLADAAVAAPDALTQVMWIVPHLLLLQQQVVLHAAAVEHAHGVIALSGSSGLGKSTLARLLAEEGMNWIADDLVIVRFPNGTPEVAVGAEPFVRAWAAAEASHLVAGHAISTAALAQAVEGPTRPLARILFPERKEMPQPTIEELPLPPAAALLQLLENSFAELATPEVWLQLWEANGRIVASTSLAQARVPDGLTALRVAAADYTRRVKS